MNQPPQTGKQIVSKGEYVRGLSKKAALGVGSTTLAVGCLAACLVAVIYLLYAIQLYRAQLWGSDVGLVVRNFLFILGAGGSAVFLFQAAAREQARARRIDPGIPLTRANAADLPAPESLVRASEEPTQEQQSVLLRAATEGVERHEEQLVRSSAGGTDRA